MQKTCSKCQQEFECKSDDVANCHCSKVTLTKEQLAALKQYSDCLCPTCLTSVPSTPKKL
ncbi:MAG: cysteine-rich CWC family protein [Aureispira sp.]|nr:cysteine-rich CWC family protein [Aureispira sp.]